VKPKQSSPIKGELGIIDFVPVITKSEKRVKGIIEESERDVKKRVESAFTLLGELISISLSGFAKLQMKAREGSDG